MNTAADPTVALSERAARQAEVVQALGRVLPASDANAARAVAERCRQAIFKAQIAHAVSTVGQLVTVSIGAGTTVPAEHGDPVRFLDEVDRRLYRAKHLGRNRLVDTAA